MLTNAHCFEMVLQHLAARTQLSTAQQQYFCSLLQVRRILPRQYLLQQGDTCKYESFVCQGFLRSFYIDQAGNDHTLHFAREDWWVSDLASFVSREPATRNIIALEPSVLLQLDYARRNELLREIPAFERFWRILNESYAIAQDSRILENITLSGAERYAAMLEKYPGIEQRLPLKHIASYLGMTPVFLSQIRKNNVK